MNDNQTLFACGNDIFFIELQKNKKDFSKVKKEASKFSADLNIPSILITPDTSQEDKSLVKFVAPMNMFLVDATLDLSLIHI